MYVTSEMSTEFTRIMFHTKGYEIFKIYKKLVREVNFWTSSLKSNVAVTNAKLKLTFLAENKIK